MTIRQSSPTATFLRPLKGLRGLLSQFPIVVEWVRQLVGVVLEEFRT